MTDSPYVTPVATEETIMAKTKGKPAEQRQRTEIINIRVHPQTKETAERNAAADHRTMTGFLEHLILADDASRSKRK